MSHADPIVFASEPLDDGLWYEALPLLYAHWKEIAHYQDIELVPDRGRYEELERRGVVRTYTARHRDLLVGYALFLVAPSLHYAQILQANQDVVYLQPNMRGGAGYRFLTYCTDQLQAEGVEVVYHHTKRAHNFGRVLERQGFELVDLIYAKRLTPVPAVSASESTRQTEAVR